jgi:hypothetical protein
MIASSKQTHMAAEKVNMRLHLHVITDTTSQEKVLKEWMRDGTRLSRETYLNSHANSQTC